MLNRLGERIHLFMKTSPKKAALLFLFLVFIAGPIGLAVFAIAAVALLKHRAS